MDVKPHLFLSKVPSLVDYVSIVGEITTAGPHLLNSACCRALLRRTTNILCSPTINDKAHVFIVVHKNDVKKKSFVENVTACNLRLVKVLQLTNNILQYCLDFTLHTYLHPHWTRVDNRYLEGKTCLFQNHWMGCVRAKINVQEKSVILALNASLVKLIVTRLSTFHIKEETIQKFMKKELRTISSNEMGDNTCYVLPSFKPALVHSISYDIDPQCPLRNRPDMIAYWLDYHGMLIPSDTDIFVTLSFNFPGASIMTYPYYCVRKNFFVTRQINETRSMDSFVNQVNIIMEEKLPNLEMKFPIQASVSTVPSVSDNCLIVNKTECQVRNLDDRTLEKKDATDTSAVREKNLIRPLVGSHSQPPIKHNAAPESSINRIVPRFTPYQKQSTTSIASQQNPNGGNTRILPNFRPMKDTNSQCRKNYESTSEKTREPVLSDTKTFVPISNQVKVPMLSGKSSTQRAQEEDEFDDFDIPCSSTYKMGNSSKETCSNETLCSVPKESPTPDEAKIPGKMVSSQKKPKAPPKVMNDVEIFDMFKKGDLSKVNNHSLSVFLKKNGVKNVAKMKKADLVNGVFGLLSIHSVHEP